MTSQQKLAELTIAIRDEEDKLKEEYNTLAKRSELIKMYQVAGKTYYGMNDVFTFFAKRNVRLRKEAEAKAEAEAEEAKNEEVEQVASQIQHFSLMAWQLEAQTLSALLELAVSLVNKNQVYSNGDKFIVQDGGNVLHVVKYEGVPKNWNCDCHNEHEPLNTAYGSHCEHTLAVQIAEFTGHIQQMPVELPVGYLAGEVEAVEAPAF